MAGHSKWSQIKHKKAKEDSKRGKLFTKLIKEISVAAKLGGGDPDRNPKLRLLLEKAKEINMPQENSIRAIKRGIGELPGQHYESCLYEGYGPGNIAIIVEVLTDNKNRAIADLRNLFNKNNGTIVENGSVSWMFNKYGVIRLSGNFDEESILEYLIDYDIKDISQEEDIISIICNPKMLEEIKHLLTQKNIKIESSEIEWIAQASQKLNDEKEEKKAYDFLNALEDLDDVQNVYTNLA